MIPIGQATFAEGSANIEFRQVWRKNYENRIPIGRAAFGEGITKIEFRKVWHGTYANRNPIISRGQLSSRRSDSRSTNGCICSGRITLNCLNMACQWHLRLIASSFSTLQQQSFELLHLKDSCFCLMFWFVCIWHANSLWLLLLSRGRTLHRLVFINMANQFIPAASAGQRPHNTYV